MKPETRPECAIAVSGLLLRSGFSIARVTEADDSEKKMRLAVVAQVTKCMVTGKGTYGLPTIAKLFGGDIA